MAASTWTLSLVDRSVNPLEEGFDCAIGALQVSYPNVIDVPLCPYELVVCCAPSYLRGGPRRNTRPSWSTLIA